MKRFTFLMCLIFACMIQVKAQEPQFVSMDPENRKVLIEEMTGRYCGYCTLGHNTVNNIIAQNKGNVYTVNVHCESSLSPTAYPNLNTSKGATLYMAFNEGGGIPAAVVNRTTTSAVPLYTGDNEQWAPMTSEQLSQTSECNIAGAVSIDEATRVATITVEVYYTGNSEESTNYLTIMMLQDSIIGAQSDYGDPSYNPEQVVGNQYCHMHTLRDIITQTWGDEIAPTTAGTFITKTYEYEIPEAIGSPNGVEVDLKNIHFLAFVTEKNNGTATTPILNVNELKKMKIVDTDYYPYFQDVRVVSEISCTHTRPVQFDVVNGGNKEITSMKYNVEIRGISTEYTWEGSLPSRTSTFVEVECEIPVGYSHVIFRIVEVNGEPYQYTQGVNITGEGWAEAWFPGEEEEFKVDLVQDKFGNQVTWKIVDAENNVLASDGPWSALAANGIKLHRTKVKLPNNGCFRFIINDEGGNGINCGYGEGYYKITDSKGNVIVQGDGKFGKQVYHDLSTREGAQSVGEMTTEVCRVFPNPVKDVLTITGENMTQISIFNAMGQMVKSVNCNENTVQINVDDLQNGMYFVNVVNNNGEMTTSKVVIND